MNIYQSKQWINDIDEIIANLPELPTLSNKSIMITGAAGLICSSIVDILIRYNEIHNEKIIILAAGRWIEEMINRFHDYTSKDYFKFVKYDASTNNNQLNIPCDYIIHGASNATPDMIMKEPVETMNSNFLGMLELLNYAKKYNSKRLLYISSSEIYGKKNNNEPYKENEYGYIDLLNSRNSYSISKRATETLCVCYSQEYDIETVIVRPGHIYGPTASPNDTRVSSMWAYNAAKNEDIVMKSDGKQLRSYCYCLDCASAILKVLISGKNNYAYNISNPESIITIKEMAEILSNFSNIKLIYDNPTETEIKSFNPMNNSSLESANLEDLNWKGCFNAKRGFEHTVTILKESM